MPNWLAELRQKMLREEGSGTVAADGTEQTVREYVGLGKLHIYLDLAAMQAGDTTVIRQYMKIKAGGAYRKYAEETYVGVQSVPLLSMVMKPSKNGAMLTLQQTAGVNRSYDWQTLVEQGG